MSVFSSLAARSVALVHPAAAADELERTSHEAFLFVHLAVSFVTLLAAPLVLAFGGVPRPWQVLVFVFLQAPLAASALLIRTGSLRSAQILIIAAVLGLATTLDFSVPGLDPAGLALYTLVPLVAAFTLDVALIIPASLSAAAAYMIVAVLSADPVPGEPASMASGALIILPTVFYVTALALSAVRIHKVRARIERIDTARHQILSRAIGDLVLRHDRSGGVLFASEESQSLFALSPSDLTGRGLFERIHVADRPLFLKTIADAIGSDTTVTATLRLRTGKTEATRARFDGPVFAWIEFRARYSADETEAGLVAIVRDVTRAKLYEEEIEAARIAAERANLWKDRFLANVSHELRTPLNAIIGFAEMLGNEELAPKDRDKCREYAQIIETSGQHLLAVVNSILDVSKIEAGAFELTAEPFSLPALVDSCCDMIKLRAERASIALIRNYAQGLEEIVADKRACKQILINLLSNAVKFTPASGRIVVDIKPEGNSLKITVADTGIGVSPADLSQLGAPFFQASANYDRHFEGTGLGLSVVRGLVGLHGGSISIESAVGAGTAVAVRLPLDCRNSRRGNRDIASIETMSRRPQAVAAIGTDKNPLVKIA